MKTARLLASLAMILSCASVTYAQNGCARLSWDSCDPWVQNRNFGDIIDFGIYRLVESMYGLGSTNIGTETEILISAGSPANGFPDAWRFDDAGCQGGSRFSTSNAAVNSACPAMGNNPIPSVLRSFDPNTGLTLRLSVAYDEFTPLANTRYTAWEILFDHTYSWLGPGGPGSPYCDDVLKGMNVILKSARVTTPEGNRIDLGPCDVNQFFYCGYVTWDEGAYWPEAGGGCGSIPTLPTTWGRLKGLYH